MTSTTNHAPRRPANSATKTTGQSQSARAGDRSGCNDDHMRCSSRRHKRPSHSIRRSRPHHIAHIDVAEECQSFFADLEPFTQCRMDKLREQLRCNRRDMGAQQADVEWIQVPLNAWLDHLDAHTIDLDGENMAALAVGLNEVMSIRDALILSLVVDKATCDVDMLLEVVSRPCAKRVTKTVHNLLGEAFDDTFGPDRARCQAGLMMLNAMSKMVPETMRAQPLAVIAYVLWWVGDNRASSYALQSLEIDQSCSLAAIVLKSLHCGLEPACCSR